MRPTRDENLMAIARTVSLRSTCDRRHVGVVVARAGRPLVTGYNGAPAGLPHCNHSCDCGYPGEGGLLFEGKHLSTCQQIQPCTKAVHAEVNAIAYAARWGVPLEGSTLYTTYSPCLPCAQVIINAGIIQVVAHDEYHDNRGYLLLQQTDIRVDWYL